MNDYEAAQQVRDGILPSPTKFGNAWLFALRISGSGSAARPAVGETTYRPPEIWTSLEMQARVAGLVVTMGHPPKGLLDSTEYAARNVGSIVLGYTVENELWGIAKIRDEDAAHAMMSGAFSTSPGVALGKDGGVSVIGETGTLLIENDPALLDHVAIVPNDLTTGEGGGVWDRGGPGTGIRNDSTGKDKPMADEKTTDDPMAALMTKLDTLATGMGAIADMCGSLGTRMDAMEKARADSEPGDSRSVFINDADHARGDATAEHAERDQKDLAARNAKERNDPQGGEAARADAQARADAVAQAFGERAPAPLMGEKTHAYRVRLARRFQNHCPEFKEVDLSKVTDAKLFAGIEARIYTDAMKKAQHPDDLPDNQLREVVRVDPATGTRTISFYGKQSFIGQMKRPNRFVTGVFTGRGTNGFM